MITFIHAADLHLDSPFIHLERYEGTPVEDIRGATRRALENLVTLAMEKEVHFAVIAGDLYDGDWRDFGTGLFFVAQMARLREADIPVFLIQGNHDAQNRMTKSLRMPENVRWLSTKAPETIVLDDLGVAIHGQGFPTQAVTDDLSRAYPPAVGGAFNVGMLHTCAEGVEGHARYAPCSIAGLKGHGYDYWALGHVHQRRVLSESPQIHFPGNTQGRHINEPGAKGCLLVSVSDTHEAHVEFRALDVFRWARRTVDVTGADSMDDCLDSVSKALKGLLEESTERPAGVRVTVTGECGAADQILANPERLREEIRAVALDLGAGAIWVEQVELALARPRAEASTSPDNGPLGELVDYMEVLKGDPLALSTVAGVLDDLTKRLPQELREGDAAPVFLKPDGLRRLLDEVRPLLLDRLTRERVEE